MLPKKPCPVPAVGPAVAADDERRPLIGRADEVRVGRAVEERRARSGRPRSGTRSARARRRRPGSKATGDVRRRTCDRRCHARRPPSRPRGRARTADRPTMTIRSSATARPLISRYGRAMVARGAVGRDAPEPVRGVVVRDRHDRAVVGEAVGRQAEDPLRSGELGLQGRQRRDRAIRFATVEVPPVRPVGDEVEPPIRRPARLGDRLAPAARDPPSAGRSTVGVEVGDPQLRAVPGHVG